MNACNHDKTLSVEQATDKLETECEECGAICTGEEIGDDGLCYDAECALHVYASIKYPRRAGP